MNSNDRIAATLFPRDIVCIRSISINTLHKGDDYDDDDNNNNNNINNKLFIQSNCASSLSFFFLWRCGPTRAMAFSFLRFLDDTQRRITVGRTPLDEWSARRRDLYLTTHNTHNRQTSMPPAGFETTISAGERLQNYALDRAVTGTGKFVIYPELYQDAPSEVHKVSRNKCF